VFRSFFRQYLMFNNKITFDRLDLNIYLSFRQELL